jgi:hypothetical protein
VVGEAGIGCFDSFDSQRIGMLVLSDRRLVIRLLKSGGSGARCLGIVVILVHGGFGGSGDWSPYGAYIG